VSTSDQIKIRAQNLKEQEYLLKQQKEQQKQTDVQNTVYSIEKELSRGDREVGSGNRRAVLVDATEAYTDNEGNDIPAQEAYWSLEVDGKPTGMTPYGGPEELDEITKFVTETAGKYGTYKLGSIKSGHMYVGNGEWLPRGAAKEFPLKVVKVKDAEDGKYYMDSKGVIYYFTKKDGYKKIK
jgi:hypothetical protein